MINNNDLEKFYSNIEVINKEIVKYNDEQGNIAIIPLTSLLAGCTYKELNETAYKQAIFNREIPKDLELNEIETVTQVDKSTVTHKDKDKFTIVDVPVKVKQAWIVKNGAGISKAYATKDEALKVVNGINDKYLPYVKGE